MNHACRMTQILILVAALLCCRLASAGEPRARLPEDLRGALESALAQGEPPELLVTYDAAAADSAAKQLRAARRVTADDDEILRHRLRHYAAAKEAVAGSAGIAAGDVGHDYSHLPLQLLRVRSREMLDRLLASPQVTGLTLPGKRRHSLAESLPLIRQPQAAQQGATGTGTAVAVLDTGVDYTRSAFGSCSAPGPPCKVLFARDFAPDDGSRDADGHGTNVAGIVLGVAPGAGIIALDVFRTDGYAYDIDIIAAINWAIAQKSAYNIVAINLSLGSDRYTIPITAGAYKVAIDQARNAGIVTVAASGNEGLTDGINSPAAVDTAVSVGAVYDSTLGAVSFAKCTDATTAADMVACFSNSAPFLSLLAPGGEITAAGWSMYGTSQATPHVAGAVAALRTLYPAESVNQIIARLTTGVAVTDPRNGLTKPRLDLLQAVGVDLVPDPFQFVDQTTASLNTPVTSNPVTVKGISDHAAISVTVPGSYSINGGAFTAAAGSVARGDLVRVRITSPSLPGLVASTTLTVGGIADTFSVTTVTGATVQLSPLSLAFGSVVTGTAATRTVTLTNGGSATLSGISLTLPPGQEFAVSATTCGTILTAGQSCTITLRFAPTAAVSRSALLAIASSAQGSPHTLPLTGTGVGGAGLGTALDAPDLTFTTGGSAPWFGQTAIFAVGGSAAQSGVIGDGGSSFLETVVTGPGMAEFSWKVSSEQGYDFLRFAVDGTAVDAISGTTGWAAQTYTVGSGSHTLRWSYEKDPTLAAGADAGWVDGFRFTTGQPELTLSAAALTFGGVAVGSTATLTETVTNGGAVPLVLGSVTVSGQGFSVTTDSCSGVTVAAGGSCAVTVRYAPPTTGDVAGTLSIASNAAGSPRVVALTGSGVPAMELGAALDTAALTFVTGGRFPWFAQTAVERTAGNSSAQSGPVGSLDTSYVETTVVGPGRLTFFWKVSSAATYDRLTLLVDGVPLGWISGEMGWEPRSYDLGAGSHTVRWSYLKTAVYPAGSDAGWLDQVGFTPLAAPVNLAEAVDSPAIAWRSDVIDGSTGVWSGQGAVSYSGGAAAESPVLGAGQRSTLRTTVTGPGTLSFRWKVSSQAGHDLLCVFTDYSGTSTDCISGEAGWSLLSYTLPPGVWPIDFIYVKDASLSAGADRGWVDTVSFTPAAIPLGSALDNPSLPFETIPTAPWYGESTVASTGGSAAQSSPLDNGQRSWLRTTVTGPGTLGFSWKVSSEAGYDVLRLVVDGVASSDVTPVSGEVAWSSRSVALGPGEHQVSWVYEKDGNNAAGADAAWVDGVTFTPDQPTRSVTVIITGSGSVNSTPNDPVNGIACTPRCTSIQPVGASFTLIATAGSANLFSGWGGDCAGCGVDPACPVLFDSDKSCRATFSEILAARIGGSYYPTLFAAYAAAATGALIETQGVTFSGDLLLDRGISVGVRGGYDAVYGSAPRGITTIQGRVVVVTGSLVADQLAIR